MSRLSPASNVLSVPGIMTERNVPGTAYSI